VSEIASLRKLFGDSVDLNDENDRSVTYRILAELTVEGRQYAILQSDAMLQNDDIEVFRVVPDPEGDLQLETVEDDEEWELVAEAYDDSQFGSDDQP
jgi:uncharacterized protein YrzB (UPF0473 family)